MKKPKNPSRKPAERGNKITLPFEQAVEGLLSVKPKKKPAKKKKPSK